MNTIPLNDLKRQVDEDRDGLLSSANRALTSGWWLNGREEKVFCEQFARYIGVAHCVGVANGTDALEIAMRAVMEVKMPVGREMITVANAGGYATVAAWLVGLTPVYVDIDEASQLMCFDSVVSALTSETAMVVATHLYGGVLDVPSLRIRMDKAGFKNVPIIEDCAQAHGVHIGGRAAGSLGDIATFSFYPTKNLGAFGDGGAIVCSNVELFDRCCALRQYGWSTKYTISHPGGRNSRLDEVQAAILTHMLPKLDSANARRVKIIDHYEEAIPPSIRIVRSPHGTVAHLAVLLCDHRDALRHHLAEAGIQTDIHYPVLDSDQPGWYDLEKRIAPTGIRVSKVSNGKLLTIPCFPSMREEEVERVCRALSEWQQ